MSRTKTETLGQRIRRLRRAAGLSQRGLADLCAGHVSNGRIGQLEVNSHPDCSLSTLEALARALGVSPAYLAGWDHNGDTNSK